MQLVPYEDWHFWLLKPRELKGKAIEFLGSLDQGVSGYAEHSTAYTALEDGQALGAGGVLHLWKGVGEAWLYVTDSWEGREVTMLRTTRKMLDVIMEAGEYHRVQAAVRADFREGLRLIEFMKFKCEGEMPGYGPNGETFLRYARTVT